MKGRSGARRPNAESSRRRPANTPSALDDKKVTIRAMRSGDIPSAMALLRSMFTHPWTAKSLESELGMSNVAWIVASAEVVGGLPKADAIVGIGSIWILHEEAHITTLAVDPSWRRLQIGTRLLEALAEIAGATPAVIMILEVRASNAGALEFYSRIGFEEIGRRKGYYPPQDGVAGEDAIVLGKKCGSGRVGNT